MAEPTMRERMLTGELYIADDPDLARDAERARTLTHRLNAMDPNDGPGRRTILSELLGAFGDGSHIRPPFMCDYGYQTFIGARTFANFGLVCLDVAIGENTVVGAGSVVLRDLPPDVVAVGNPARIVKDVEP
jgi:maltose O-acetyltransferase